MPTDPALMSILGPMLEIGPRVLLVMACGLLALAAVRISARAIRQGHAGVFLVGWGLGIVGVCGARIGFASLAFYGSPPMLQRVPDPMSGVEIWRFLRAYEAPIALALGSGVLIALWLRRGREVGAAEASRREARSWRIGAAGEARVAGELKRIGLPALHNVILRGAGWSVELDHLVRVPSGIVVLETKTFGGTIEGQLDSPVWTQPTAGSVEHGGLANPVLQNQAHVSALEGFWATCGCRYAVTSSRPAEHGLHRRSRTRSFPFEIYHGCCRFPLPSRTRALSMRRGGGLSTRRRRAPAAVRSTRLMRAAGGARSGLHVRRDYLRARIVRTRRSGSVPTGSRPA